MGTTAHLRSAHHTKRLLIITRADRPARLIGDEVNLASRLEAMCKQYGVDILVSGETYRRVQADFLARPVDRVVAVGKSTATDIYELVSERSTATPQMQLRCDQFAAVVESYRARDFAVALGLAMAFEAKHGPDAVAAKYIDRCRQALREPPPPTWDFSVVLTSK